MSEKYLKTKIGVATPNINFYSSSANSSIQVTYLDSNTLSFSGSTGQLFSITDSQTGTIFAVNDISGVPSIEVDDDGTIRFAETFGNVLIGTATDAGTGKLQVAGAISVAGYGQIINASGQWVGPNSGLAGYTGSQGIQGYTGSQGVIGYTGSQGIQGVIGYTGSQGIQGAQGVIGYTGSKGDTGAQGVIGYTGSKGDQGIQGIIGYTGSQGIQGTQGITGYTGSQGPIGYTGSRGYTGSKGDIGYTGSKGDTGLGFAIAKTYLSVAALTADTAPTGIVAGQFAIIENGNAEDLENSRLYLWTGSVYTYVTDMSGSQGIQGPIGYTGSQGPIGPIGYTGSKGDIGYTGSQGIQGVIGYTGSQGSQGVQGVIGYTGSQGVIGYTGSQGPIGYTGSQGSPDTAAQILAKLITVDGAGSGLDADLLDGVSSASYVRSDAADDTYRLLQTGHGVPYNNLGTPSITEMALFQEQFNNKTEFFPIANLFFETSTDGSTWTNYTVSDTEKKKFVGGDSSSSIYIPNGTVYFRVRFKSYTYVFLNALYSYWSTNGHSTTVQVYTKAFGSSTWTQYTNSTNAIGSWPGHLYLPFNSIAFNPSASTDEVAFVFQPTWNGTYPSNNINLYRFQIWGGYPAGKRTLYSVDSDKNANFPAAVGAQSVGITGIGTVINSSGQWVGSNSGLIGYTGSQGIQGAIGYTGSQGIQGVIGYTGSQGIIGYTGSKGDTGTQGVIGYTGSKGDTGAQGVIGYTGSQGIGYTGSKGDQGIQGPIGYTGSQGTIGYTGSSASGGASVTVDAVAPTSPVEGSLWWDTESGKLFVYYTDGDSGQWVETSTPQIGYTGSIGTTGYTGSIGSSGYTGSSGNNLTPGSNLGTTGGSVALDCSSAETFVITLNANTTFTFTNPITYDEIVLHITNGGAYTVTLPGTVVWSQGIAPSLTAAGTDVLTFLTTDGGTTWKGVLSMVNVS